MTKGQGPVLGVLSSWFGGTYFGGLFSGIAPGVAARAGTLVAIQTLDAGTFSTDFAKPPPFDHRVAWAHVDGFIVFLNAVNPDYLLAAQRSSRPVVVISDVPAGVECPTVLPDNASGVRAATEHLLGHGHRRIAYAGHAEQQDVAERYAAFTATLAEHGIEHDPALFFDTGNMQVTGGVRAARAMLAAGLPSTAVLTGNDQNAIGLIRTLAESGCDLPADQAVIGFDNLPGTAYVTPSLTTVHQPLDQIGERAVDVLTRMINGEQIPAGKVRVETTLHIRESCGCPGPLSLPAGAATACDPADLARNIRAALKTHAPGAEIIAAALSAAVAGDREVSGLGLRRGLTPLSERIDSYETVVAVMRIIRDHGRLLQAEAGAADRLEVTRRVEDAIYQIFVQLAQAQATVQAAYGTSTMAALGMQYSVSMELLRSQERDPRSLEWLRTTDVRGGCLGLWPAGDRSRLDVITTFDRRGGIERGGAGSTEIDRFPPAEVVAMADVAADDMLYIAHLKVGPADWGMLALVGPIEAGLAEGRETMNQWAALLSVALEHDAALTTLREQEEYLRRAALYDDLTGLPNRTHFRDRLAAAIARTARRPTASYAVLLLDLDGFKLVNDSLGHEAGDRLLQGMAGRLRAGLRATDTAARLGGDEFAVLIEDYDQVETPAELAERLQELLSEPYHMAGTDVVVSASIGIALGAEGYADPQEVLRDADAAMYFAKAGGKRAHAVFAPSMHASAVNRLRVQADLRQALAGGELVLYQQPIVDLATGRASGAECLIRWQHPARGLLGPGEFLPVAEDSHLILQISDWVVAEACRQAADRDPPFLTSVNVPNRQFWDPRFVDEVRRLLAENRLDPGRLALEITEGVIMHDVPRAAAILESLHALGTQIHIDDFGTGYSSLQAIHNLPFDALKVDRSFIARITTSRKSRELVRTIVAMGRNLGLDVIAEGIETPAELAAVRELGCTHGQGYLFSRPVPAAELTAYLGARL